jgi:hypothetical protein
MNLAELSFKRKSYSGSAGAVNSSDEMTSYRQQHL